MGHIVNAMMIVVLLFACAIVRAQVVPLTKLNTGEQDYAAAFRSVGNTLEVWVTTNAGLKDERSRKLVRYVRDADGDVLQGSFDPAFSASDASVSLDGCITFSRCQPDYGVFVSNRNVNGRSYGNDLYECTLVNNVWTVRRMDELSSTAWDDTPALSADGRFLYFASDRRAANTSMSDIFVSERVSGRWSEPRLVSISTDNRSEQTPGIGPDGKLYYAADKITLGDYDIWVADINASTGNTTGEPHALALPGVNMQGSREGHPSFSSGGSWFVFSSDREKDVKQDNKARSSVPGYDLYGTQLGVNPDTVEVTTILRGRSYNASTRMTEDSTAPWALKPLSVKGQSHAFDTTLTTNRAGVARVIFDESLSSDIFNDLRQRSIRITADVSDNRLLAATDTLLFDAHCGRALQHRLVIYDTAVWYIPECVQEFPVKNVRFFVTGYWCPTTEKYQQYLTCTSIFSTEECMTVKYEQPVLACEKNEMFSYAMKYEAPKAIASRRPGSACIDVGEARTKGSLYAQEVDKAIDRIAESMASALRIPCVLREVAKGKPVTVEVTGWTDPRPLDKACTYTGPDVKLGDHFVVLDTKDSPYIDGDVIPGDGSVKFSQSKAGGNYLLSQLRAFYAAEMLDKTWEASVPEYRELKAKGLLKVRAIGRAVSQDNIDNSQRRSVEVRISVPMSQQEMVRGAIPDPGARIVLCTDACDGSGRLVSGR